MSTSYLWTTKRQLTTIPSKFHCDIPSELADEIAEAKKGHVTEIGVEWAAAQAEELLNRGVPSLHFYLMQSSKAINMLMARLNP